MLRQWTRHVLSPTSSRSSIKYPIVRNGTLNTRWLTRSNKSNGNERVRVFLRHLSSGQIRDQFCNYFKEQQFQYRHSASLIPHDDRSLLFTNAGMVPWKNYFIHPNTALDKRLISIQKCVRAGGKHNDLDNVGYTPRHHTFFEMLGFFSFGDLSKTDAIRMAWQFLTETLELPVDRLSVTVYDQDQESYEIWRNVVKLPDTAIKRHGDRDNFWSMGDEGPCGPCTEIFWDTQQTHLTAEDRWIEIWNIVFMQYNRTRHGQLESLPIPCIDTGMGLERLASVLQNKVNNFDTDLFTPLKNALQPFIPVTKNAASSELAIIYENIIVDHVRSSAFLVADGITPSNVGRGYVLRRIIRRAIRAGQQLGIKETFLYRLVPALVDSFKGAYPDLSTRSSIVADVLKEEEQIFRRSLDKGIRMIDQVFNEASYQATKTVPGEVAFQLYATHGFPLDLTRQITIEHGWQLDEKNCQRLIDQHRESGRASKNMFTGNQALQDDTLVLSPVKFIGYTELATNATVTSVVPSSDNTNRMSISIDPCPFYGLGGGQASDTGYVKLASNGEQWKVLRVRQPKLDTLLLDIERVPSTHSTIAKSIQIGDQVEATVNVERRRGCAIHHTATHLLNAALKHVLGKDIMQAGSDVDEHRLRFDFTHGHPLTTAQIKAVESFVNEACLRNIKVTTEELPLADALASGAVATFTEKYANQVRVVKVADVSAELCGGTHVHETLSIYPFRIRSETSVAAGTRRIEAIAGVSCTEWLMQQVGQAEQASSLLNTTTSHLVERVSVLQRQLEQTQATLQQTHVQLANTITDRSTLQCYYKDTHFVIHVLPDSLPHAILPYRLDYYRRESLNSVHVVLLQDKVAMLLDRQQYPSLHAGKLLKMVLAPLDGKGGGKPDHAQGRLPINKNTESDEQIMDQLLTSIKNAMTS
ncbi:tRNA synthetases class II (A)-domain-containing protein [Syncephalis plumigaleata]|nr:tRNA synthetases class II (A)-domain-containing protein [Syncephalis plumigaleata]